MSTLVKIGAISNKLTLYMQLTAGTGEHDSVLMAILTPVMVKA